MLYVYFLSNEGGSLYYGSTNDLKRRLAEHNTGKSASTKNHQWKLAYYEAYLSESDGRRREKQLKSHGMAIAHLKKRISASLKEISAG